MNALKKYNVVFSGLPLGKHHYDYKIDNKFFDSFEYADFNTIEAQMHLELEKKESLLQFQFELSGKVEVCCDRCGESLLLGLQSNNILVVKFSDEAQNEGDDLIILQNTAYEINVAQYIYEYISLAIPTRRVHDHSCGVALEPAEEIVSNEQTEDNIDPRWKALEKLKTKK